MEKEEKIINDKVDELLKKMEGYYKEAIEAHKPIQESLDQEVRTLMDEFDERGETKRYQEVKDLSDYIALTLTMPMSDKLKENVVEEIVKECGKNGTEASEGV